MAVTNAGLQQAWTPEQYGSLIDTVIAAKSIAFAASTVVQTSNEKIRFPMLTADPAVGWYAENTSIALTDPNTVVGHVIPQGLLSRNSPGVGLVLVLPVGAGVV